MHKRPKVKCLDPRECTPLSGCGGCAIRFRRLLLVSTRARCLKLQRNKSDTWHEQGRVNCGDNRERVEQRLEQVVHCSGERGRDEIRDHLKVQRFGPLRRDHKSVSKERRPCDARYDTLGHPAWHTRRSPHHHRMPSTACRGPRRGLRSIEECGGRSA
eukprot:8068849-Pyramimonas_sp.AAC.1